MAKKKAVDKPDIPLSQNQKKITRATREEVIADLQRIAKAEPEKVISRNYYRNESPYAESAWNAHFGTFAEFKRQAGIVLTRDVHLLEKHIAKHASKDAQRDMMAQKADYEGKYLRPTGGRWKTVLVGSDQHDTTCDPFYRRLFIEAARRAQPDVIVLNGDIFDMTEFGKYVQDPREYKPIERIKWVHTFLADLRQAAPNTEIHLVEGNHEFRLIRHLTEATPAMVTVLADLHGFTVPKLLGLDLFEVNYLARADLSAFHQKDITGELRKNYLILWDCLLMHHFPEGFSMGYPGINGHHHRHTVKAAYSPQFGPYEWHQIGAGHVREASYCAGEKWSNGFIFAHVDTHTKRTAFDYVDCSHEHAVMAGVFYFREPGEAIHKGRISG